MMSQISRSASLEPESPLEPISLVEADKPLVDGIILIDKPAGPSSAKTLARVKHAIGALGRRTHDNLERIEKISLPKLGHGGTLDPFASGLLVCLVGRATKLLFLVHGGEKEYLARVKFGERTITDDLSGVVIESTEARPNLESVTAILETFVGEIDQLPPQVSAKRVAGERAYNKVRRGEVVELKPKQVKISAITVEGVFPENIGENRSNVNVEEITLRIRCSSGTYIRSIARDLGIALGCGAHLTELRRTKSEPFSVVDAVTESEFMGACQELGGEGPEGESSPAKQGTITSDKVTCSRFILPWYTLCANKEQVFVSAAELERLYCGHQITITEVGARGLQPSGIGHVLVVVDNTNIPRGLLIYQASESWRALMMTNPRHHETDEI